MYPPGTDRSPHWEMLHAEDLSRLIACSGHDLRRADDQGRNDRRRNYDGRGRDRPARLDQR